MDAWPKVQIRDLITRDAATRALTGAAKWLADRQCEGLFAEFEDMTGNPLSGRLLEMETTAAGYLRLVFFFDGGRHQTCQRHGILAFTAVGSRTVYLCGRSFERAFRKDRRAAQAALIHEMLHSLGLGENPPSPAHITARVQKLCWQ